MNAETVVKILREAQDAVRKSIRTLELERGFGPITGVYIENYKLLLDEINGAIQYLETPKDDPTICKECGEDMVIYCPDCCLEDLS